MAAVALVKLLVTKPTDRRTNLPRASIGTAVAGHDTVNNLVREPHGGSGGYDDDAADRATAK